MISNGELIIEFYQVIWTKIVEILNVKHSDIKLFKLNLSLVNFFPHSKKLELFLKNICDGDDFTRRIAQFIRGGEKNCAAREESGEREREPLNGTEREQALRQWEK